MEINIAVILTYLSADDKNAAYEKRSVYQSFFYVITFKFKVSLKVEIS